MVSVCVRNPKYIKYQANFFPYPQCSDKVGKGNWERPSHLSVNICGSGLQIPPDQDGCVSCNSLLRYSACWNHPEWYKFPPHILFLIKGETMEELLTKPCSECDPFCMDMSCQVRHVFHSSRVFSVADWICVMDFWTKGVLHLDGLCTHISHKSLKHCKPETCEFEIFTISKWPQKKRWISLNCR